MPRPSPSRPVRWGLIGCGDISEKRVAPALRDAPGSALVAVARAQADKAADFAARHGASRSYADWRDLVRDEGLDAVYVATPVRLHAEQAVAAAEAGKHVLCEKPMALDPASCERMIAAARAHDVRLGVAYYRHHYPVVRRLRGLIDSGEIGGPVLALDPGLRALRPASRAPARLAPAAGRIGGRSDGRFRLPPRGGAPRPPGTRRGGARLSAARVRFKDREVEDTCVGRLRFAAERRRSSRSPTPPRSGGTRSSSTGHWARRTSRR